MTVEFVLGIVRQAILIAGEVAAPMLLAALVIGILISLFMAVTQINEATLTFIPKILVVGFVGFLLFPWMTGKIMWFTKYIFTHLSEFIR